MLEVLSHVIKTAVLRADVGANKIKNCQPPPVSQRRPLGLAAAPCRAAFFLP
jgi:hypothetical protein